jgi:cytochrome b
MQIMTTDERNNEGASGVLVWDLPVRVIHWGLVTCVLGAWLTRELEGDWFAWHTRFGYGVLVLVITRILWGFLGTRHARFADFVRGPRAIAAYLRSMRPGNAVRGAAAASAPASSHAGHNPLGALMILVFLAMLLTQALTGLFANDQVFETGPLFGYVTIETSDRLTSLHKQLFDWIVVAVAVHVAAALLYLWVRRENLILPMISGRKSPARVPAGQGIDSSRTWLAVLLALLAVAVLVWVVQTAPEASLFAF